MQVKVLSTRVNKKKKPASKTLLNLIIYVEELVILFISSAPQYHLVAIADSCIFKSYFIRLSYVLGAKIYLYKVTSG